MVCVSQIAKIQHKVTQIGYQMLTNSGAEVTLSQSDESIDEGDRNHGQGQPDQPSHILIRQSIINEISIQKRGDQTQTGDDENRD